MRRARGRQRQRRARRTDFIRLPVSMTCAFEIAFSVTVTSLLHSFNPINICCRLSLSGIFRASTYSLTVNTLFICSQFVLDKAQTSCIHPCKVRPSSFQRLECSVEMNPPLDNNSFESWQDPQTNYLWTHLYRHDSILPYDDTKFRVASLYKLSVC